MGLSGEAPRRAAAGHGIALAVVKLPDVTRGVMFLPRRFQRRAQDQERSADVVKGLHVIAFTMLMGKQILPVLSVL